MVRQYDKSRTLQFIQWAYYIAYTIIRDIGVNKRGFNVIMSQQLLNETNIRALFQQMCGVAMAVGCVCPLVC
jgi:hypothetical protein